MSGQYDPRTAALALRDTIKRQTPKIVSSNVAGLVDANERPMATQPEAKPVEGLCILIRAIEDGSAELPLDLRSVTMSRAGLLSHVRPDGGVCLGFFGNSRDDAVVLYGDPLMPPEMSKRVVFEFWKGARVGPFAPKLHLLSPTNDVTSSGSEGDGIS